MEIGSEHKNDVKRAIRKEVRCRIRGLSADVKALAAEEIFRLVERTEAFARAHSIAFYAAMDDEVPTSSALLRWPAMGKHVVVPRVEGDVMRFYDYAPERMQTGAFGIAEPVGDSEYPAGAIDLIIVPARAFTRDGVRLGRGGGFYDKYMSLPEFRAYKIGVAFGCQMFEELVCDDHDVLVDEVIASTIA